MTSSIPDIIRGTLSLLYDFAPGISILDSPSPYIGGGIGIANISIDGEDGNDVEDDETGVTFHGELGLTYNLTDSFALMPQYRFEWFDPRMRSPTSRTTSFPTHSVWPDVTISEERSTGRGRRSKMCFTSASDVAGKSRQCRARCSRTGKMPSALQQLQACRALRCPLVQSA